jgi:integrase/recombinase XerC
MNEIVELRTGHAVAALDPYKRAQTALGLWLAGFRSDNTRRAYRTEFMSFATFTGHDDVAQAAAGFVALDDGAAHAIADAWRQDKLRRGLSPAAINRSMSALNSFVNSARRYGVTALRLEAKGETSRPYRDTKGPGVRGIQQLLAAARDQDHRKAARDVAIVRLAFGLGLRRGEIASLDVGHVDLEAGTLSIMGKGRGEREPLTLPPEIKEALASWLTWRNAEAKDAPLFICLSTGQPNERISGSGVYHLIRDQLGKRAGINARPHGLRHTAVTAALDVFGGDYRKVRAFSRHSSLDIVRRYDDADHGGQVAAALSAIVA